MHSQKTRFLVFSGVFLAVAVLLSSFSVYFGPSLKVSLAPAAVIFAGIVMGPVTGAVIGAASDVLVLFVKALPNAYFPGFTLTMALYGLLGGLLYRSWKRADRPSVPQVIMATLIIQTVCSLLINTGWLVMITATPYAALLLSRLPLTAIGDVLYTVILIVLVRYQDKIIPRPVRLSPR